MESYEKILGFWFGQVEQTILPSEHRAKIWFAEDPEVDKEIRLKFVYDYKRCLDGGYNEWCTHPRGQLAQIIMLDQFSRHIHRNTSKAFAQDAKALEICLLGIDSEAEHHLSLIERVFYYFPLLHSELVRYQEFSLRAYQNLSELAFSETRVIYDSFLKFANHHYTIVRRFGRFPQRNKALNRESTEDEIRYLDEIKNE